MNEKQTYYDWVFGLQWLATCALGMLLLGMVAFTSMWDVGWAIEESVGETAAWVVIGLLFGSLFVLGASIGPGLLLRGKGVDTGKWIAYSTIAGSIGASLGFAIFFTILDAETMPESLIGLILGLFIGLPVGIAQWLPLRTVGQPANIWPVIVTVAFVIGFTIGIPLGGENREWIALGATGLVTGAITALSIVRLMGRKTPAVA